jgi:hypothetical protein
MKSSKDERRKSEGGAMAFDSPVVKKRRDVGGNVKKLLKINY